MRPLDQAKKKYIAAISEAELAVRLCEAFIGMKRPTGATAEAALTHMDDEARERWQKVARTAMAYWSECIAAANHTH